VLAADVPIFSMHGDPGPTPARMVVSAVGGVESMLQMVDRSDIEVKCICNNLRTLDSLQSSNRLFSLVSG